MVPQVCPDPGWFGSSIVARLKKRLAILFSVDDFQYLNQRLQERRTHDDQDDQHDECLDNAIQRGVRLSDADDVTPHVPPLFFSDPSRPFHAGL